MFYLFVTLWLMTSLSFRHLNSVESEILEMERALKVPEIKSSESFLVKRNKVITFYMVKNKTHNLKEIPDKELLDMASLLSSIFVNDILIRNTKFNHVVDYFADTTDLHKIKTSLIDQIKFGVPASVKLAQSAIETGYGKSIKDNNYFGIKTNSDASVSLTVTHEYYNKKQFKANKEKIIDYKKINNNLYRCKIKDKFSSFDSPWHSFRSHSEFLKSKSRYQLLFTSKDYKFWAENLYKCGYATDIKYSKIVKKVIEDNNLQLLDF